jgi:hypothetical protein
MNDGQTVGAGASSLDATIKDMGLDAPAEKKLRKAIKDEAGGRSRRTAAETLEAKYPHMVKGSLTWVEGSNKQRATINCQHEDCEETREVFTSDLFQVRFCATHKKEARKARKAEEAALLKRFKEQQKAKATEGQEQEAEAEAEEVPAEVEE